MNDLKDEFNLIKEPKELLSFMDKYINYGILGSNGNIYIPGCNYGFLNACLDYYELCDSNRLLKCGYGTCWDQVELERTWFRDHNYEYKTFYIWFNLDYENSYFTHTYLVYKNGNKYYYFEHADGNNKGIKEFTSYEEAIKYQMNLHIKVNLENGNLINDEILSHLEIIEYNITKYGCSFMDYINQVLTSNNKYYYSDFK